MQYEPIQMIQTFGLSWPNFGPSKFFEKKNNHYLLDIIILYHDMQYQPNIMIQTRESGKKSQIWAILGSFNPMLDPEFFENPVLSLSKFYRTSLMKIN